MDHGPWTMDGDVDVNVVTGMKTFLGEFFTRSRDASRG